MTGKTHYKLGILYYIIFSILPIALSVPIIRGNSKISLASAGAAALGALIVDSDTEKSLINKANPVTRGTAKITSTADMMIRRVLRLIIGVTAGFLILYNQSRIVEYFGADNKTYIIMYAIAFTCMLAAVTNETLIKRIPVLSIIYNMCSAVVRASLNIIKRFIILTVYFSLAIGLIIYNLNNDNQIIIYIAAIIILGTAIFPHRTFLHSVEGFILYTFIAIYTANILGRPQLGSAFAIGYFSHVYLADILTNSGVPVSVIPRVLKKIGIHKKLMKFTPYKIFIKAFGSKISACVMSTGTASGNIFEFAYCMILFIIALTLIVNNYYKLTFVLI